MEKFIFLNIRRKREDIAHMCVKYNLRLIDVAIAWKFFKKNIISPSNMHCLKISIVSMIINEHYYVV